MRQQEHNNNVSSPEEHPYNRCVHRVVYAHRVVSLESCACCHSVLFVDCHWSLFLEMTETTTASFTARFQATTEARSGDLCKDGTVYLADSQRRRDVPDVIEGNTGKFATPFSRNTYSTEESRNFVAKSEPTIEAGIGQFPDTVDTANSLGFCQHILELDLELETET